MLFPSEINIISIIGNEFEFKKSESTYVPGRTFHGLTYRVSGKISIKPEGSEKKLLSGKNCITFVPKGCSYDTEILEDGKMLILHFDSIQNFDGLSAFVLTPTYPVVFENLFKSFIDRYRSTGGKWDYSCISIAYEILANLFHELSEGQKRIIPPRMRNIKTFIDENYGKDELSLPSLAGRCGISEVYFRKEFKECFGVSPLEYIKKVRIENAKGFLSSGLYRVSDIATMCGFDSISYFSYEFKRMCGETPIEFSKKFVKQENNI